MNIRHSDSEYKVDLNIFRPEISHFLAVAQLGNISKASDLLGFTQPQMSKAIASLEANLGQTLFVRKSRGVELTSEGQFLLKKIQTLQASLRDQDEKGQSLRRLRIGFHHSVAMKAYPLVVHPLHLQSADFQLSTEFGTSLEITRKVADLQIDFGLVINPQKNPDVVARRLESDSVALWFRSKMPSSGILYFHPDMFNVQRLLKKIHSFQKIPVSDYEVIAQIVATQKKAVGILPESLAHRHSLDCLKEHRLFSVDVMLIAHREKLRSPANREIFQHIQNLYSGLTTEISIEE